MLGDPFSVSDAAFAFLLLISITSSAYMSLLLREHDSVSGAVKWQLINRANEPTTSLPSMVECLCSVSCVGYLGLWTWESENLRIWESEVSRLAALGSHSVAREVRLRASWNAQWFRRSLSMFDAIIILRLYRTCHRFCLPNLGVQLLGVVRLVKSYHADTEWDELV